MGPRTRSQVAKKGEGGGQKKELVKPAVNVGKVKVMAKPKNRAKKETATKAERVLMEMDPGDDNNNNKNCCESKEKPKENRFISILEHVDSGPRTRSQVAKKGEGGGQKKELVKPAVNVEKVKLMAKPKNRAKKETATKAERVLMEMDPGDDNNNNKNCCESKEKPKENRFISILEHVDSGPRTRSQVAKKGEGGGQKKELVKPAVNVEKVKLMAKPKNRAKKETATKAERVLMEIDPSDDNNNNKNCCESKEKPKESRFISILEHVDSDSENVIQNSDKQRLEWLEALRSDLENISGREKKQEQVRETSYTQEDLRQFLAKSSIRSRFAFVSELESTTQLLEELIAEIYDLDSMQLDELLDLYHVGIIMFNFRQEAHRIDHRYQLLQAVAEMGTQLEPIQISYIGMNLCKRFVVDGNDNGVERMRRIIDLHSALLALAGHGESNCKIAMTTLLATFSTVSEVRLPQGETDIIQAAFSMAKLVDWKHLITTGREADVFVLVRSFGLIINTRSNRLPHPNWDQEMGSDIHRYFMTMLATVRCCPDYGFFHMMLERFTAFCVVRGATPCVHMLDMLDGNCT